MTTFPQSHDVGSTVVPTAHLAPRTTEPEKVRFGAPLHERLALPGALIAAIAFGLLVGPVLGLIGGGWIPITAFGWMLVTYAVLTRLTEDLQAVKDRFSGVMIGAAGLLVVGILALVIGFVLFQAAKILGSIQFSFLTSDMGLTGPLAPLSEGGVKHAIVGTLEQIGIALTLTIP
ncbi:MAG: hypothetical protein ACJ72O_03975, partial [Marmoricola sp.]